MTENIKSYVDLLKRLAPEAERLVLDSRKVKEGDVFIAVPGLHVDGRQFLEKAAQKACAVVYEDDGVRRTFGVPAIAVPNLSRYLGRFAAFFYRNPSASMSGVAITGTNGKTTSSHWISQLLSLLGEPCAAIGTIGCMFEGKPFEEGSLTTPDAVSLQDLLSRLRQAKASSFALEASSIGLVQDRMQALELEVALFTNLTRDHLDYHGDMASYERAKAILFDWPGLKSAVINIDDEAGVRMAERAVHRGLHTVVTTTKGAIALAGSFALSAQNIRALPESMQFDLCFGAERHRVKMPIFGEFNISNLLGVVGVALAKGYALADIVQFLPQLVPPAGRMQLVSRTGCALAVVDYSHTPDAVKNALVALRPVAQARRGKLWIVVGAGGDRDAGKRPMMAEVAEKFADRVVLTSDNPRTEDPQVILGHMLQGLANRQAADCVEDRRKAIAQAMSEAASEDIVLIAGKGHELYQEIDGVKHPFSDLIEARNAQWKKVPLNDTLMSSQLLSKLLPGSKYLGSDVAFTSVCTDTREVKEGALFFALKGERFDGHNFVMQAMRAGAAAIVVDHEVYCPLPQIIVKDVKLALGASASYWRRHRTMPIAAVAGSNGKTTTTQMIAAVLEARYGEKALATKGNFNNDIGVPLMLWRLRDTHEAAVIETGMNHPGEMQYLAGLVQPTVAVVTNAQREHQEFLQTVEATARENGQVFKALPSQGTAVIAIDDACKDIWLEMAGHCNVLTFGLSDHADVTGKVISGKQGKMTARIKTPVGSMDVTLKVNGEHNLRNALATTAVACAMNISLEHIAKGLEAFEPIAGRGKIYNLKHFTVIDDAYNANPDSMRACIDVLASYPGPHLLILADMRELGDKSRQYHEEIGAYAAERGIETVIATGEDMQFAIDAYKANGGKESLFEANRKRFMEAVLERSKSVHTIAVKGSNFYKLNQVVTALTALKD